MENTYFITNEPDELIANLKTPVTRLGKFGDWNNGYGKYTAAILILWAVRDIYHLGLPSITADNWFNLPFLYVRSVLFFLIAFYIYKGSFNTNRDLLVINRKGILYREEIVWWNDVLSFQIALVQEMKNQSYAYYLYLRTKNNRDQKISLSVYNKKFDEIHAALLKNMGKHEVKDLGFTQIL